MNGSVAAEIGYDLARCADEFFGAGYDRTASCRMQGADHDQKKARG